MEWWMWVIVGLALFGLELFVPTGFYLLIIGFSCTIVGVLTLLGVITSSTVQFSIAGILGLFLLFTVRRPLSCMLSGRAKASGSDITAQKVRLLDSIDPGASGKGELTGSNWSVRNETTGSLDAGSFYRVGKTDGVTLVITDNTKV